MSDAIAGTRRLERRRHRAVRIGLVAGGLGAYWPQFPGLLDHLQGSARFVSDRLHGMDCDVVDVGFISDPLEGAAAAETLRAADCDMVVIYLTTYLTSSMVLPIAQRAEAPVLVIDMQPSEHMDHATFDTGEWLAYCGQCPLPEVAERLPSQRRRLPLGLGPPAPRAGVASDRAVGQRGQGPPGPPPCPARLHGPPLSGHVRRLYGHDPGVVAASVGTWRSSSSTTCASASSTSAMWTWPRARRSRGRSSRSPSRVNDEDFDWAARVSVGLDRLVEDFKLDSVAYYHRGLDGGGPLTSASAPA